MRRTDDESDESTSKRRAGIGPRRNRMTDETTAPALAPQDPFIQILTTKIEEATDEEALNMIGLFLDRVSIYTDFLTDEESGVIIGHLINLTAGDFVLSSDPSAISPPLVPLYSAEANEIN